MNAPAPPAHADSHLNSVIDARGAGLTDNSEAWPTWSGCPGGS